MCSLCYVADIVLANDRYQTMWIKALLLSDLDFKKKTLNKIYIQLETYSLIAIISLSLYIKIFS